MGTDAYRFDVRTKEQFIVDIEKGNARERLAIILFKNFLKNQFGFYGDIVPNGCDMSGDFINDISKVNSGADYLVGENKLPLEVKTSTGHNTTIYLKVNQVDSYIRQGASVLYVNGIERPVSAFTFWTFEDLKEMRRTCERVIPPNGINGGKESFKIDALKYSWLTFAGKEKKYVRF
ncbi:hypothetical protein ABES03_08425 [Neobacillus rhizosphaerae]|uniref:hypothetical protein n=1 Tax=Neobacillus rhizosphaerae TaxID=2880965 RepID=UPI003D2BBC90